MDLGSLLQMGGGKGKSLTTLSGSRMDDNFLLND